MPSNNNQSSAPIILVDGSSYLYRAYHALPPLTNSNNQPTGAIRGVISMVKRILEDHPKSPLAIIFDAKGKTFRHELYPQYKANRPSMPDDLVSQIKPIHEIIEALGIKLIKVEGVEADDVIGTLASQASKKKLHVVISTGDKDLTQLVGKYTKVVNTMNGELLNEGGVKKKFGVPPNLIVDYLTLMGDASDNIPGVDKVGPKTAVKWLKEHKSLAGLIKNIDQITGKVGENLRESLDKLALSKELVTIKKDVLLDLGIEQLKVTSPDDDRLEEIYKELEFNAWLKNEKKESKKNNKHPKTKYEIVLTKKGLDSLITKAKKADVISIDTETTGLEYVDSELVGISLSLEPGKASYIPFGHTQEKTNKEVKQLNKSFVLNKLKPLLESSNISFIGQNIKFDRNVFSRHSIKLDSIKNDTMIMSYILNSTATRHNLDALANHFLNYSTTTFEEVAGKGVNQITFDKVPVEEAAYYAGEDADITLQLFNKLNKLLEKKPRLKDLLEEIEIPLITVLSDMEQRGAYINARILKAQSKNLFTRISKLEKEAFLLAEQEFNLNSPKQLQEIFFDKLKFPVIQKTPGGQPSTAENVLIQLALDYELPKIILEHRTLTKLKTTYTDKLPLQISKNTNRVHTSFHQAVTTTGRLSSSDPNLQNIPIRTEDGRRIRQAFESPRGYKLISADYSQIELRVMAHLSNDSSLIEAFKKGEDIHSRTASEVFDTKISDITYEQRANAKAINFGLIYGISAFGLSRQLGINRNLAAEYIDTYFIRYPGVKEFMESTKKIARDKGYVETLFGRRLYLPEILGGNAIRRRAAERAAINAPVQGTAADIMKKAMIKVQTELNKTRLDAKMILQVHDEIILEVKEKNCEAVSKLLEKNMSGATNLKVPLEIKLGVGNNWDQVH